MANIYDYLKTRGHISFEEEAFNEVDNLVLAQIAYTDFDGIENIKNQLLPIEQVKKRYFELNTRQDIEKRKSLVAKAPLLLDYLAESNRFKNLKLGFYKNILEPESTTQFSAIVFDLPHMVYIAYRGTDDTIVGWKEDFYFSLSEHTIGQKLGVEYANQVFEKIDQDKAIHLGGHSKGGNLARYAGAFCNEKIKNNISVIWDNDGPGFSEEFLKTKEYLQIKNKIVRIIPQTSIVGLLMENDIQPIIIKSDAKLILQHVAENWQVEGNLFLREPSLSKEAIFVENSITTWLEKIPDGERRKFIDAVFSCAEMAGYQTLTQLSDDGIEALINIKTAADSLTEDDKKIILELLNMLIEDSKNILRERIKERIKTKNFPRIIELQPSKDQQ